MRLRPVPVFPKRELRQARKHRDCAHDHQEGSGAKRHDVRRRKRDVNRGEHEDRAGEIAMQPPTPPRVHKASDAHDQESGNPKPSELVSPRETNEQCRSRQTPEQYSALLRNQVIRLAARTRRVRDYFLADHFDP